MDNPNFETFCTFPESYYGPWKIKISGITGQVLVFLYNIQTCETHFKCFVEPREAGYWIDHMTTQFAHDAD